MEKAKQNINGDTLVLRDNEIRYHSKVNGTLYKIITYRSVEEARKDFNRQTCSYRGCGKNVYMKHPQARVYYSQLIIEI